MSTRHNVYHKSKMPTIPVLRGLVACVDNLDILILVFCMALSHDPVVGLE